MRREGLPIYAVHMEKNEVMASGRETEVVKTENMEQRF